MTFEEVLMGWLPEQRWFAGKGTPIDHLAIVADTLLVDGDPGMRHLIVAVSQAGGTDRYQLLEGLRTTIPGRLEYAVIGPAGTQAQEGQAWTAYDALHDPPLTRRLLQAIVAQEAIGPLRFAAEPDAAIDTGLDSLVLTGEQSNTSMLFGEEAILKVFRRPQPGRDQRARSVRQRRHQRGRGRRRIRGRGGAARRGHRRGSSRAGRGVRH